MFAKGRDLHSEGTRKIKEVEVKEMEQKNSCAECLNLGRAVYCMQCIRLGKGSKDKFIRNAEASTGSLSINEQGNRPVRNNAAALQGVAD